MGHLFREQRVGSRLSAHSSVRHVSVEQSSDVVHKSVLQVDSGRLQLEGDLRVKEDTELFRERQLQGLDTKPNNSHNPEHGSKAAKQSDMPALKDPL